MDTVTAVEAVRARVQQWRAAGLRIAFVPTMGNLHAGHMSLLAAARYRGDRVVTSIFVNPLQFGPSEDYTAYPRTLLEDQQLLQEARCDLLFAPSVADMYPYGGDQRTLIVVRGLSDILCGRFRPGHFDGVATVVAKLFGIVAPDVAVFGEKDYQQLLVVRHMTLDLALPVEIVGAPTVRAPDGLALSSRNRYLSPDERARAALIHQSLSQAVRAIYGGDTDHAALERAGGQMLERAGMSVDYFAVRNAADLTEASAASSDLVVLTAVRLGRARLIDNLRTHRP
ncbi:MAG TPA: pantoate--beta-alanine ligase [Steroidobacteraceae bacterium]|jgi:pantoate--beta-alanine ligase|nr:pantoate--beta-alanine ligase [Steroidobacteraceae bacterium]